MQAVVPSWPDEQLSLLCLHLDSVDVFHHLSPRTNRRDPTGLICNPCPSGQVDPEDVSKLTGIFSFFLSIHIYIYIYIIIYLINIIKRQLRQSARKIQRTHDPYVGCCNLCSHSQWFTAVGVPQAHSPPNWLTTQGLPLCASPAQQAPNNLQARPLSAFRARKESTRMKKAASPANGVEWQNTKIRQVPCTWILLPSTPLFRNLILRFIWFSVWK